MREEIRMYSFLNLVSYDFFFLEKTPNFGFFLLLKMAITVSINVTPSFFLVILLKCKSVLLVKDKEVVCIKSRGLLVVAACNKG